jgi:peptidoglycan/LPS O-acetylase OafA/YrhL
MDAKLHRSFYRPEIDGLRSIAVLPVIWFHAGFALFSGGFVGVDVFFVISGYLITSILAKDLDEGRFSILAFYERRARRILPALFLVIAVTLPFALSWMIDRDLSNLGRSMMSVAAFVSNLFFWTNNAYFDPAAGEKPLLHTWSLAVEEQYYCFFPLLLLMLWSLWRRATGALVLLATIGSLALAQWASIYHPVGNFYMLPTRAWELLAGSLVAITSLRLRPQRDAPFISTLADGVLAVIGLGLIVYSIFAFNEDTPFPSLYTAVPVLGTAMIILFASSRCLVGRVLALKPLVAIGLVSYSAYLWHQPLFALYRLSPYQLMAYDSWIFALLVLVVFGLAWLTWKYVETPLRVSKSISRRQVFWASGAGLVLMLACGTLLAVRYNVVEPVNPDVVDCQFVSSNPTISCKRIGSGPHQLVVWGDSHALPMIGAFVKNDDYTITVISVPGCPPMIGLRRYDGIGEAKGCDEPGEIESYAREVARLNPEKLLLVGRWTVYLHGWQRKNVLQHKHHLLELENENTPSLPPEGIEAQGIDNTVAWFKAHSPQTRLFVMEQVPDIQMFGHVITVSKTLGPQIPEQVIDDWDRGAEQVLRKVTATGDLTLINTKASFCDGNHCTISQGEDYFYVDDNHLSISGAARLREPLRQVLMADPVLIGAK